MSWIISGGIRRMTETIPLWAAMNLSKRWIFCFVIAFQTRLGEAFLSISCELREDLKASASKIALDTAENSRGDGAMFELKRFGNGVARKANIDFCSGDVFSAMVESIKNSTH
jgi:hypothetical protein